MAAEQPLLAPSEGGAIVVPSASNSGTVTLRAAQRTPDADGVLQRLPVEMGPWDRACYFAACQENDPAGLTGGKYPGGLNRIQGLTVEHFRDLVDGGVLLLVREASGEHLALLPIVTTKTAACFTGATGELSLTVQNFGRESIDEEIPVLSWGRGGSPQAASAAAWAAAVEVLGARGVSVLRQSKTAPPEMLDYLGWCTWEHFKRDIDETNVLAALDGIEASGLPIRYVIIDDGHVRHTDERMRGFDPDPEKFPRGWAPIIERRDPRGVRWFGLWLDFNGYWGGIDRDHHLPAGVSEQLTVVSEQTVAPAEGDSASEIFYDAWFAEVAGHGFDFVKVDDQAQDPLMYAGSANPAARAVENSRAMERAADRHLHGLINCMAHSNLCAFNTLTSSVTRCSEDYVAGNAWQAKAHLHNSFLNMLWLAPTVWGDHDMFHSNDSLSAEIMAMSKALSGGPVYLSDPTDEFRADYVWPLCEDDGRLLRTQAPGQVLTQSVYTEPFRSAQAVVVGAPLAGEAVAIAAFNLTEPETPVVATWGVADYVDALGLDGADHVTAERLAVYDWRAGTARLLTEPVRQTLDRFSAALWLVCPVRHGWAVIGRPDKYLSPAGVRTVSIDDATCVIETAGAGAVLIWSERPIQSEDAHFERVGDHLWRADDVLPGRLVTIRHSS